MKRPFPGLVAIAALATAFLAGCIANPDEAAGGADAVAEGAPFLQTLRLPAPLAMNLTESVVTAAAAYGGDLYEPTMEVSADGTIFVTGHTILADTTGAPVFRSTDGGATWTQLPFFQDLAMPGDLPGATPPPSDEIFLVAGDDGWLYGVDITLATFPVNAWRDEGASHAYHNPNAYDEHQAVLQAADCIPAPVKDRPWAAYADGTLLMVSNPAAGPVQIGVLPVPPALTVGPPALQGPVPVGVGATSGGGWWNLCAGPGYKSTDCSIPGIPDMRADGLFIVPQRCDGTLYVIKGNKVDVTEVEILEVFPHSTGGEITSVYGIAAFDHDGTLFVGISNNTAQDPDRDGNRTGQLRFALSNDGGQTFQEQAFVASTNGSGVRHFYMDGNRFGDGALVVWAVDGNTTEIVDGEEVVAAWDWYAAHLQEGADGLPVLENVSLILDEGPQPSAHVTGAAVGPDGRAYTATFVGGRDTPISVWIQESGPTMPVAESGE